MFIHKTFGKNFTRKWYMCILVVFINGICEVIDGSIAIISLGTLQSSLSINWLFWFGLKEAKAKLR